MPPSDKVSQKGISRENTGLISNGYEDGASPSYEQYHVSSAAPPSYAATKNTTGAFDNELDAAFSSLAVAPNQPDFPEADHCLAHLKLLSAFHALKEDVGYNDGIFGLWNATCEMAKDRDASLAKMRDKRWALYIARAAERFQDWWLKVLCNMEPSRRLEGKDLTSGASNYTDFTKAGQARQWTPAILPPLDVLMVWHSFMLNPRSYLEDCVRFGLKDLWATGMPWTAVNAAIDTRFNYSAPEEAKINFAVTGHEWENEQDPMTKKLRCPRCSQDLEVPWTTCCAAEKTTSRELVDMYGCGYGDRNFAHVCQECGAAVNHAFLLVGKFKGDVENNSLKDWPLGGTVLSLETGGPVDPGDAEENIGSITFPNRLFRLALRAPVLKLTNADAPKMDDVRLLIDNIAADRAVIKGVNAKTVFQSGTVHRTERLSTRKMMKRYWENPSIFALELGGAVVRQSVFVDKMYRIDWIHSPAARETMDRLLLKYSRFMKMIASYPWCTAVPTLDVDLAWHTHQLSTKSYFDFTMSKAKKFIDHDDKIDEDALSKHFQWTTQTYEAEYGEVYSECTCWYCEAVRANTKSGKLFGMSKAEKALQKFHDSGAAKFCEPDKSAHISAHPSVTMVENPSREEIIRLARKHHDRELEEAYQKACKRAKAKGRPAPERNEYYQGPWGYPMLMYGPYMSVGLMGGIYYAGDPCVGAIGAGAPGNCALGSYGAGTGTSRGAGCGYTGVGGGAACGGGGGGCGGGGP